MTIKNTILTCFHSLMTMGISFSATNISDNKYPSLETQARQWMQAQSISFLENKGQMVDMEGKPVSDLLFQTDANGANLYITTWGLSYVFIKTDEDEHEKGGKETLLKSENTDKDKKIEYCRADMKLVGVNIKTENIIKEYESEDYINYYLEYCPDGIRNVRRYGKITIKEVYPKIDWMIYVGENGRVKYDFIVHPGGDPMQIILQYKWVDNPERKNDGSLNICTPFGTITEGSPYSYIQETNAQIQTAYTINKETGKIHFTTGRYNSNQTLIIDPQLQWGTYYGGSSHDGFNSVAADGNGNVFVTGYTWSSNFPTINPGVGAYFQGVFAGGSVDVLLLKFSSTGARIWATYYGGSGIDLANCLSAGPASGGNVFVTGWTDSPNFPIFNPGGGAYFQGSLQGSQNAFILKFTSTGQCPWATYYGNNGGELGSSIALDGNGNVFVTGWTGSTNFPTFNSGGAYFQGMLAGGSDVFLLKFSNIGVRLWATYYGGSGQDVGSSIAIDASGNVFVTGYTGSSNFPTFDPGGGAYFQAMNTGSEDIFLLKFSNTGSRLWATYYGGSGTDRESSLDTDGSGNVFVTGYTDSLNFPTFNPGGGAYFQAANAGSVDVFLLKFSNDGVQLWATHYGGSGSDRFYMGGRDHKIVVDGADNVFVTGQTDSPDFPTFNPGGGTYFQGAKAGGIDVFLLKFSNTGTLLWATYNGTASLDFGTALAIDPNDCLIAVGEWTKSGSNGLMNSGGAYYDGSHNGLDDSYIMKFCASILSLSATSTNILCNGECTGTATAIPSNGAIPYTYSWNITPIQTTATSTGLCVGTYTVTVTDSASATATATVTITQPSVLTATITSTSASCGNNNGSAALIAGGGSPGYTYSWNSGGQTTATATGLAAGNYTATVTDANSCTQTQTVTVTSSGTLTLNTSTTQTGCAINNGTATATPLDGTAPYAYSWSNGQTTIVATGLGAGTYTITVTDASGCTQTQTVTVTTLPGPIATANANPVVITAGDSTQLSAAGGGTYNWSPSIGLSCVTCSNLMAFPLGTTMYCVTVTDTITGCSDSACVTVLVEMDCSNVGELYLPNAFSPNGDGENDKLQIYYGNIRCLQTFNFVLYNRWGEKVFETTNPVTQWDGYYGSASLTIPQGRRKMESTAVFVYYLKVALISGEEISKKGNISLIR